jgi:hypothetical protein
VRTVFRADNHNHEPDVTAARRGLLLTKMHEQIADNPSVPVRRVYDRVANSDSGDSDEIQRLTASSRD